MGSADDLLPPTTAVPHIHVTTIPQLSRYELTRVPCRKCPSVRPSVRSSVGFMSETAGLVSAKFDLKFCTHAAGPTALAVCMSGIAETTREAAAARQYGDSVTLTASA